MSLELINLTHIYSPGTAFEKKAVDGVSLKIETGCFAAIVGHTGSGKSTLIQHFNALIKPSSGQVLLDGADINSDKNKLKDVRRKVGIVFQYPEHQLFEVTVAKDVAFGPANMGLTKEEIDERVAESLELVGIPKELFEKSPFELSGGQKRRVAIAGVLAMRPKVLVLDEPTAGLDPRGRGEILENIRQMHQQLGITVILVSHNMEDVAKLAQKVFVLNGGKLDFFGTPEEVFSQSQRLEAIGLSSPQITHLIAGLNKNGFELDEHIITVEKAAAAIMQMLKLELS